LSVLKVMTSRNTQYVTILFPPNYVHLISRC
jgi:hypothetical protein